VFLYTEMTLKECTWDNTSSLRVQNIKLRVKVLKVYDGDTITVAGDFFKCGKYFRHKVRLKGINAPEIRTKCPREKKLGLEARQYLRDIIEKQIVTLIIGDNNDKYGRTSAVVVSDNIDICEHLVQMGYARYYDGGKRTPWYDEK
jgi:micrococcal nuclease